VEVGLGWQKDRVNPEIIKENTGGAGEERMHKRGEDQRPLLTLAKSSLSARGGKVPMPLRRQWNQDMAMP